jgi:hypothetical protein
MAPVHPKVKAGSAAAAAAGVIVWLLGRYVLHGRVDAALTAEIYAAVPAVLAFAAGWVTPARKPPAGPLSAAAERVAPASPPVTPPQGM